MRRIVAAALIAVGSLALLGLLQLAGALPRLELLTHDARLATGAGRRPPDPRILVAWIDQDSMDFMRREAGTAFPWPRSVYGDVLAWLRASGAKVVAFDILFDQPGNADEDRTFGETIAAGPPTALAAKLIDFRDGGFDAAETARIDARGLAVGGTGELSGMRGAALPIPELETKAAAIGFVNLRPDPDQVNRHYDQLRACRGKAWPSLALAAAMLATGDAAPRLQAGKLVIGGREVAVDAQARMALNLRARPAGEDATYPYVKFVNVFASINAAAEGKTPIYPPERFKDKIVLVGINAEGYADIAPTPLAPLFAGVELHATALDNLLHGDALRHVGIGVPSTIAAAVLGVAAVFATASVPIAVALVAMLLVALGAASVLAFGAGLVLPTAGPLLALLLASGGTFLYRLLVEGRQKRELRKAFTQYLAPEVVAEVLKDPTAIRLGGASHEITVMFSDLAGFTTFAERNPPEAVVAFMNDYFTRMCDRILAEAGVIDKFIGDAIMALFGAPLPHPDHAARGLRAAVRDLAEMGRINAELAARGAGPMKMRIGLHTGPAVVGNMGSDKRFDYTAIGDTVNLASRLEGAGKYFGVTCLASEATWRAAGGAVLGRELGRLRVVGRKEPIAVYQPFGLPADVAAVDREFLDLYNAAAAALAGGTHAEALFRQALGRRPDDVPARMNLERLATPGWDGVFVLEGK